MRRDFTCALLCPLVLLLGIFLYTRWRSYKGLKEGVYHVSAHHDGWEDIRENVLNYDEEGGGEEDQVKPPVESPDQFGCVCVCVCVEVCVCVCGHFLFVCVFACVRESGG